jgi:hypothetical protein
VADRTPSLAEEARHLHACLFGAPLDAVTVARYEAALQVGHALACPSVVSKVVGQRLDAEAVEFALRRRGLRGGVVGGQAGDLARRMQILCYLVEVQPAYLGEFVNVKSSRGRAWAALLGITLRSGWKLVKGEYLIRRHGLV